MDHTLLPIPEKKALRREYHVRALIVAFFMISLAFVIGIVASLPSFVKATFTLSDAERAAAEIQAKNDPRANNIQKSLATAKVLVAALDAAGDKARLSQLVDKVIALRDNNKITAISLNRSASSTVNVVIQGVAPTREGLIALKERLQSQVATNNIDLPLGQLTKTTNVSFSLQFNTILK